MKHSLASLIFVFVMSLTGIFGSGCSSAEIDPDNPESIFQDAEDDAKSDHFQMAHEKFSRLKSRFPYSKYATLAQLRNADVYFKEEAYAEAAASYQLFAELHPTHEKVPYALFQAGEALCLDIPSIVARDLSSAHRAIDALENYLRRFPNDENADKARERVKSAKETLAAKEMYIGNFYFRRSKYMAAQGRYQRLVTNYPDSLLRPDAEERLRRIDEINAERAASEGAGRKD